MAQNQFVSSNIGRDQRGQALSEYIILVLLVTCASLAMVRQLGSAIKKRVEWAKSSITKEVKDPRSGGSSTGGGLGGLWGGD